MLIEHRNTEPSVWSSLRFTPDEVRDALVNYAVSQGIIFPLVVTEYHFRTYEQHPGGSFNYFLENTTKGTNPGIIKINTKGE